MLQAITPAITRFARLAFGNLTGRFIRLVLEGFVPVRIALLIGNLAKQETVVPDISSGVFPAADCRVTLCRLIP
jgi:hypothetical protein